VALNTVSTTVLFTLALPAMSRPAPGEANTHSSSKLLRWCAKDTSRPLFLCFFFVFGPCEKPFFLCSYVCYWYLRSACTSHQWSNGPTADMQVRIAAHCEDGGSAIGRGSRNVAPPASHGMAGRARYFCT
jgi:hypothetical protein